MKMLPKCETEGLTLQTLRTQSSVAMFGIFSSFSLHNALHGGLTFQS